MKKLNFKNDYSNIAHPFVLERLKEHLDDSFNGYGLDEASDLARQKVKDLIQSDADVHFLIGGTSANKIAIAHALRPYEAVIAVESGHIAVHETGAIEQTGHKILTVKPVNGKIVPEDIVKTVELYQDNTGCSATGLYLRCDRNRNGLYERRTYPDFPSLPGAQFEFVHRRSPLKQCAGVAKERFDFAGNRKTFRHVYDWWYEKRSFDGRSADCDQPSTKTLCPPLRKTKRGNACERFSVGVAVSGLLPRQPFPRNGPPCQCFGVKPSGKTGGIRLYPCEHFRYQSDFCQHLLGQIQYFERRLRF